MADSTLAQTWPGMWGLEISLPGANSALAGITGAQTTIRGTDPAGYSADVMASWLGGTSEQGSVPSAVERWGVATVGILVALLLIAFGLYALVKDA